MLADVILSGSCKKIQLEFVIPQSDLRRLEAGPNEHGPVLGSVCSDRPLMELEFFQRLKLRRYPEIHSDASFKLWL